MNQSAGNGTAPMSEKKTSWRMIALTAVIFIAAFVAWKLIISSAPVPKRGVAKDVTRLVDATPLQRASIRPEVLAGGTVLASEALELQAEVSGRIEWLSPAAVPGAWLKQGDLLARIDATDYQAAVRQAEAALAQARAELAVEQGQITLAEEEYELAGLTLGESDRALVLREPQRQVAEAAVATAEAQLLLAKTNLTRTEIRMPFDGRIVERYISPGSQTGNAGSLFSLLGTATFYVEVKVPRGFLPFLDSSQTAEVAPRNASGDGQYRIARVLNVLPQVDSADRQVRIMLAADDPMNPQTGPVVLVNDYVQVRLYGREIQNAFVVPRRLLTTGGEEWVVNAGKLALRPVEVIYAGREDVWINTGFEEGDQLLLSQVDSAVPGMAVRVAATGSGASAP